MQSSESRKSIHLEASKPKWVNPNDIWYVVNSLRLGGLLLIRDWLKKQSISCIKTCQWKYQNLCDKSWKKVGDFRLLYDQHFLKIFINFFCRTNYFYIFLSKFNSLNLFVRLLLILTGTYRESCSIQLTSLTFGGLRA